jgi:tetratricopeptide (TPR) repeat protein
MSLNQRTAYGTLAIALLCCLMQAAHAYDDKVTLKKGSSVAGRITQCDWDNVAVQSKEGQTSFAAAEINDIEWDGDQEFRSAEASFKTGRYNSSASTFKSIIGNKEFFDPMRAEVKPFILYAYAESLYRTGKLDEAIPSFERLISENQKSYYVPPSIASLVDAVIQKGQFDKVGKLLEQLRAQGSEQRAMADYYEGQMLLAQHKTKEADRKYSSAAAATNTAETKAICLMGEARCALEEKNLTRARELALQAVEKSSSTNVAGFAHLIAGNVCMVEAEALSGQKKLDKLMDALLEFMRNDVQYNGDPRTEPESVFKAAQVLEMLSKQFPDSHGPDRNRAATLYSKLASDPRFRGSQFANEAAKSLQAMK